MMDKMDITKVIFRYWKKEIIAIFPEICGTNDYYRDCQSYMHIGQHSTCIPDVIIMNSRPAFPHEYADLKNELESIVGYNLKVIKKNISNFSEVRRKQIERG